MVDSVIGKKFHMLTVICQLESHDKRRKLLLCQCDCGRYIVASRGEVVGGRKRNCGNKCHHYIDIAGHQFGRLTAIKEVGETSSGDKKWLCQCECGNQVVVKSYALRKGLTRSCGCLRRELGQKRFANDIRFLANKGNSTSFLSADGVNLVSLRKGERNTSGVIGVSKEKKTGRWNARLYFNGKYVLLKTFDSFEEAVAARKNAEAQYLQRNYQVEQHSVAND